MRKCLRWISILSLITLIHAVIPIQSLAAEQGIFLNYSSSKKLTSTLKFYETNYPTLVQKYDVCNKQVDGLNKEVSVTNQLLDGCNKDKVDLKKVSKEFEQKYTDTSNNLIKCEGDKPSRTTWFLIGGGVFAIIATSLAVMFARR